MIILTPCSRKMLPLFYLSIEIRLLYLLFGFLHPTQLDVQNQTHKVYMTKMLHTIHKILFDRHHFHRTNPLVHVNSRLQNANSKIASPYYMNYRYIINSTYCEGTLRKFDATKNYFLFLPLYAKTHRPILVPNEYL